MGTVSINKKEKLTEHFTLGEMTKTSHKTADGNIPSHVAIENLKRFPFYYHSKIREDNLEN